MIIILSIGLLLRLTAVGIRCADHVTPLYPQKLVLTSPTGGGRSVGIVRLRTKATEFVFYRSATFHALFSHIGAGFLLTKTVSIKSGF